MAQEHPTVEFYRTLAQNYVDAYASAANMLARSVGQSPVSLDIPNRGGFDQWPSRYVDFLQNEGTLAIQSLTEANLRYVSDLLDTGIAFANQFYQAMGVEIANPPRPASAATSQVLMFRGAPGATVSNGFVASHGEINVVSLQLGISSLKDAATGHDLDPSECDFAPDTYAVQPGPNQVVRCSLKIPERAVRGCAYEGSLLINGVASRPITVHVTE